MSERTGLSDELVGAYRAALAAGDEDAVQEIILKAIADAVREHSADPSAAAVAKAVRDLLSQSAPRVIQLARWRAADGTRTQRHRAKILAEAQGLVEPSVSAEERLEPKERLLDALATLSNEDVALLWGHAHGQTRTEVAAMWRSWGLRGPAPASDEVLRQRIHRARQRFQAAWAKGDEPPMSRRGVLTNVDHENLDAWLAKKLDEYRAGAGGERVRTELVGRIAHVIAAIDKGNMTDARRWISGYNESYEDE